MTWHRLVPAQWTPVSLDAWPAGDLYGCGRHCDDCAAGIHSRQPYYLAHCVGTVRDKRGRILRRGRMATFCAQCGGVRAAFLKVHSYQPWVGLRHVQAAAASLVEDALR